MGGQNGKVKSKDLKDLSAPSQEPSAPSEGSLGDETGKMAPHPQPKSRTSEADDDSIKASDGEGLQEEELDSLIDFLENDNFDEFRQDTQRSSTIMAQSGLDDLVEMLERDVQQVTPENLRGSKQETFFVDLCLINPKYNDKTSPPSPTIEDLTDSLDILSKRLDIVRSRPGTGPPTSIKSPGKKNSDLEELVGLLNQEDDLTMRQVLKEVGEEDDADAEMRKLLRDVEGFDDFDNGKEQQKTTSRRKF